jgi:hypothetical protein
MIRVLSKKEQRMNQKNLLAFCKGEHSCEMYNFMRVIEGAVRSGERAERQRILQFIEQTKYLSKKKLVQFVKQPDVDELRRAMARWRVVPKMKVVKSV